MLNLTHIWSRLCNGDVVVITLQVLVVLHLKMYIFPLWDQGHISPKVMMMMIYTNQLQSTASTVATKYRSQINKGIMCFTKLASTSGS